MFEQLTMELCFYHIGQFPESTQTKTLMADLRTFVNKIKALNGQGSNSKEATFTANWSVVLLFPIHLFLLASFLEEKRVLKCVLCHLCGTQKKSLD